MFKLRIRSRNTSAHRYLQGQVETPVRGVYRCGSTTPLNEIFTPRELQRGVVEINSLEGVQISSNKITMKRYFVNNRVPTAPYCLLYQELSTLVTPPFIIKRRNSSRGQGIYFANTVEELNSLKDQISQEDDLSNYLVEHWYSYPREYRLHVDKYGCFCANRKMLRGDATERWHRHHNNSVWIREDNPDFRKPNNWETIVAAAQAARRACQLDICSVDVKVSAADNDPKFIILETNSASALGDETAPKYIEELTKLAADKAAGIFENFDSVTENHPDELSQDEQAAIESINQQSAELPSIVSAESQAETCQQTTPDGCSNFGTGLNWGICQLNQQVCRFIRFNEPILIADDDDDDDYDDYDDDNDDWNDDNN